MIPQSMQEHVEIMKFSGLFSCLICALAWFSGYFCWGKVFSKANSPSFVTVVLAFCVYFILELLMAPALIIFWFFATEGSVPYDFDLSLEIPKKGWINISSIVFAACALLYYCWINRLFSLIWFKGISENRTPFKDFFFGVFTWTISYPIVITIVQIIAIVVLVINPTYQEPIDQTVVKYLKALLEFPFLFWTTALIVIILVPFVEEILFRGLFQNWLSKFTGRFTAILGTSLFFASMHFSVDQGIANLELLLSLFVLSCFLGFIYERQRSLWAPIGLHITFNGISVLMILWKHSIPLE